MTRNFTFINLLLFVFLSLRSSLFPQVASLEATNNLLTVDGVKILFQNGMPVPGFEKQNRIMINLAGQWKKQRFNANDNITLAKRDSAGYQNLLTEAQGRFSSGYDDSGWDNKILPAVENQMNIYPTVPEYYQDGVWYRRNFSVADSLNGKFIKLIFYAVNYVADIWINDFYVGYHEGGYTSFAFDVSPYLNYGGNNVIAVRVDNPAWGTRNDIVPYTNCDWFNYTGIIHDVYLEVSEPVSVIRADIVPLDLNGQIQTTVVLNNKTISDKNVEVNLEVFNADVNENNINSEKASDLIGTPASVTGSTQNSVLISSDSVKVWRTNLTINNPRLWSPKNPNLYILKVTLKENGSVIDSYYTQFGIRTIKTLIDKVYLNNNPAFFTGVARHEDHPIFGRSIPADSIFSDLLKVKSVNATLLRTAHYPNHPYTYQITDRLGIVVVEEIPVWWFDTALAWVIQNSARHIHEQMFREMVFRDYNRPSIIMWSTTNECLDVDNRKTFITKVRNDLNFNYPDGRLITQSAAADRPGPQDASQTSCDVAGWTMYFGIFHGGTYYEGTRYFLTLANYYYPEKPILDTEFGYWSGELNTTNGQQAQVTVFKETFNAFTYRASVIRRDGTYRDGGYLMGVTWWCIFDWYSHQHPEGFQSMGLYRMHRDTLKAVGDTLKNYYAPFYNIGGVVTEVIEKNEDELPTEFNLEQNFPNPFNPVTKIRFSVLPKVKSQMSKVILKVFDVLGNEVATLLDEEKPAGFYEIEFNAGYLTSGIYFYQLIADDFVQTRKMILLK
ncbi:MULTISPECIES: glycoside hydrolase family 2 TIM barrel-domain containing protein [Ignavibacterium]|jgi:beta-glucuronidase|uniref:glycoside hydrolase family 2 TIM barrel-domain containing protein n=1 Tax=Ignavibacterium TaxID=795750 RepID=UPI0025C722DE|nr:MULTISPECIES: glycoside hydrolase family 2 TIM barrel-domain containing protein [Ignavibacterium]MBI5662615.1 T9SS type A sorting domain-containing protein [Ignavibacterium album]